MLNSTCEEGNGNPLHSTATHFWSGEFQGHRSLVVLVGLQGVGHYWSNLACKLNLRTRIAGSLLPVGVCVCVCVCVCEFVCVWVAQLCLTLVTLLPMGFSGRNTGVGCHFPPPGDLPDPGMEPASSVSPALAGGFFIHWLSVSRPD